MQVSAAGQSPLEQQTDAVVVGVFEDAPLEGPAAEVDAAAGNLIERLREAGEIKGKVGEAVLLYGPAGIKAPVLAVAGLGKREEFAPGVAFQAAGTAAKTLAAKQRGEVAFFLVEDLSHAAAEAALAGAITGSQGQDLYRSERSLHPPEKLHWAGASTAALRSGQVLGEAVNLTRRLVNAPASEIYPASFAEEAESIAGQTGMRVEVWDEKQLEAERCGALLAVARGSAQPPRLVQLRYQGAAPDAPTLAFVGKGVTFDSGGLSLKPSEGMKTMKCDMAGAATVLGALSAIAQLGLPVNVVGFMGLVENMTGPAAYKLGDVLTTRNGKTIEVHNTDAEGRLVLADTLDVAVGTGASKIIDLATLTGACVVALGNDVVGLMTNNQPWCDAVSVAARAAGELAWQLPMFPEYDELIKSEVADIKNVGEGRWGGAITAAKLLEQFVGQTPWTHIDIAGPAFRDKPKPWCDAGASGAMVRTLVEVARAWDAPS